MTRRAAWWTIVAVAAMGVRVAAQSSRDAVAPPPPASPAVQADDSLLEARTREIASVLRCPVCQGEAIQDSPSELAQQMRAVVRAQLEAGRTPEEIKAYFVSRYGEWILLEPAMTSLNVALYALPVVLVLGGLALIAFVVKRWTTPPMTPE